MLVLEPLPNQHRRDWFKIIRRDLGNAGVTLRDVARACDRDISTILYWTGNDAGEPKDSDARIVLALYRKYCPQEYADLMAAES